MIGELSGLGCAAAWAVISAVMRVVSERVSPFVVNGMRCGFAAVVLAMVVLVLGRAGSLDSIPIASVAAIVASGVLGQGLGDGLFVKAMKMIGASRAMPISAINPLLTIALAMLFLGEHMTLVGLGGALFVLGGVYLLAFPYRTVGKTRELLSGADRGGVLLALAAALCYSVSAIVLKQGLAGMDILVANLIRMSTATLFLLGLEAVSTRGRVYAALSRRSLILMGVAGTLGTVSSTLFITSVYYAGAAKAAVLASTSPLFILPISLVFLREKVNSRVLLGTLSCVVGIWLVLLG